jgi:hypothetical protein
MATAMKRARARVARRMATVTRVAGDKEGDGKEGGWAMATVTKRAMATDGNNTGNGYSKEASRQVTAATMAMGMGTA